MPDIKPDISKIRVKKESPSTSVNSVTVKRENYPATRATTNSQLKCSQVHQNNTNNKSPNRAIKSESSSNTASKNEPSTAKSSPGVSKTEKKPKTPWQRRARRVLHFSDRPSSVVAPGPRPRIRRRRRRRRQTIRPTPTSPRSAAGTSRARLGPRGRIVKNLGIERDRHLGQHSLPTYRRPRREEDISVQRVAAGIPVPSIFGGQLPGPGAVPTRNLEPNVYHFSNLSPAPNTAREKFFSQIPSRPFSGGPKVRSNLTANDKAHCDLLGNILQGQKVLMADSSKVSIQNGELILIDGDSENTNNTSADQPIAANSQPLITFTSPEKSLPNLSSSRVLRSASSKLSTSFKSLPGESEKRTKQYSSTTSSSPFANYQPNLSFDYKKSLNLHLLDSKERNLLTDILTIDADESSPIQTPLFGGQLNAGECIWNPGNLFKKKQSMPSKPVKQEEHEVICID